MTDLASLNERFGIDGELVFAVGHHGAEVARITNATGMAEVALQGAQVLTWAPAGQPAVVWLSPAAKFAAGKSLRGGAPVCWPWFGPHPDDPAKPGHGFARNLDWRVIAAERGSDGTRLVLGFTPGDAQRALWPYEAEPHAFCWLLLIQPLPALFPEFWSAWGGLMSGVGAFLVYLSVAVCLARGLPVIVEFAYTERHSILGKLMPQHTGRN